MKKEFSERTAKRIVIVGGGFAGAYCAQRLERLLKPSEAEVVLIDRNNFFHFYPFLVEAGTGSLEPRHAVVAIRDFLHSTRFVMGTVTHADVEGSQIHFRLPNGKQAEALSFDHLVLSPGSVTRMPPVEGLREHGFEMKSLSDAVDLRDRAIRQLEIADSLPDAGGRARALQFVVVGANFTGGDVAREVHRFLHQAARSYRHVQDSDIRVSIVELGPRILPALDGDLAHYAEDRLKRRGIDLHLEASVEAVFEDHARMSGGGVLETETVIWCAGIAPNPLLKELDLPLDERGYVLCDRELRVQGLQHIWAVGDSAVNPDREGAAYPATAQHAVRQGQALAKNLARAIRGHEPLPCDIQSRGSLVALGCRTGVARIMGFKISGFAAWFLWRTVYLLKMPGLVRKIRVALDWTMDLLFRRPAVQLGLTSK